MYSNKRLNFFSSTKPSLYLTIHRFLVKANVLYLKGIRRVDIGKDCVINRRAIFDGINPHGIHIGDRVRIAARVVILAHDHLSFH